MAKERGKEMICLSLLLFVMVSALQMSMWSSFQYREQLRKEDRIKQE